MKKLIFFTLINFFVVICHAQDKEIHRVVMDNVTKQPIEGVSINVAENVTPTFLLFDASGKLIDRWTGAAVHQQKLEQYLGKQ